MLSVGKLAASSLVQQKKQQWAREREEMSQLYLPWGSGERYNNRLHVRNQFASNLEINKQTYEYKEPTQRQRSPSLPPIHNIDVEKQKDNTRTKDVLNRNLSSAKRFAFYDEDGEGDTSGYGSETVNNMNSQTNSKINENLDGRTNPTLAWQQNDNRNSAPNSENRNVSTSLPWSSRSPRSANGDEGRLRWGDRGVATGRLWEPTAPNARLPQVPNQNKGTPAWVERGLNMIENTAELLHIDQGSSTSSNHDCDRSSCNGTDEGRTFLRGQNVPIEPEVKAQRENKRIKAMELQSAILSQLEDQEKRRQEEKERQFREERLEEMKIQRQQEEDKIKLEEERRRNEEKLKLEQRKLEALKKALADAERKSREEKEKRFISHKQFLNSKCNNSINNGTKRVDENTSIPKEIITQEEPSPTKTNVTYNLSSARSQKKENISQQPTSFNSPRSATGASSLNLFIHSVPPLSLGESQFNIFPIGINGEIVHGTGNNVQLAVLVPQNLNNLYSVSLNGLNNVNESTDEKILTPSKFRTLRTKNVSTQTDLTNSKVLNIMELERDVDKTYGNIDENAPHDSGHNTLKKDRRFRSEERYKKDLENRPKWGVNRPVAQYKKQSEKDPFYSQKRKIRQKYRPQARQYLSQSSEDSRSPSPPLRTDKNFELSNKHRNSISQSYWRNKRSNQDPARNQVSELSSLAVEYTHIGNGNLHETNNKSPNMSPNKRATLSQKFFNDKYGNRKLWVDDINERSPKLNILEGENRKKIIEQLN